MIGETIRRFASTYTITRFAAGTVTSGRYGPGASSTLNILASIQAASPQDLFRLPEGERSRDTIAIYTEAQLQTADAAAGTIADRITYNGHTYEVEKVWDWGGLGGYFKALAQKIEL